MQNYDCEKTKACINQKCRDPCPGVCGNNAQCYVVNHSPTCECFSGYTGNPSIECREIPRSNLYLFFHPKWIYNQKTLKSLDDYLPPIDPCHPSPCGPYSSCKTLDGHAVCSCIRGYYGSPPSCKPECAVSSDCSADKACENEKCIDPCPETCGFDARCNVVNHSPICSCPPNYTGDPFIRCYKEDRKSNEIYLKFYFLIIFEIILFNSETYSKRSWKSLRTFSMWPKFIMSREKFRPSVLMHSELHWSSTKLPTRMFSEFGMSIQSCMCKWTV